MVLDVAAQSEQQGEDGIHLAGTEIEHRVPQPLVEWSQFGEGIEIEVFEEMDDDDAHYGKSAQAIHNIDTL